MPVLFAYLGVSFCLQAFYVFTLDRVITVIIKQVSGHWGGRRMCRAKFT